MEESKDYVKLLLEKAVNTDDSEEAVLFSQAASNAANAIAILNNLK